MFRKFAIQDYTERFRPLRGIIGFVVAMMLANWFWKIFVFDGDYEPDVTFFGLNITGPFLFLQVEIVRVVGLVFELFNIPFALHRGNVFEFGNGQSMEIVWACTGLKQAFIFSCIMLTSRGPRVHKCWYIPVGWVLIHIINIARISLVGVVINHNPAAFSVMHDYFFKYIFYLIIFLIWVIWEEYFFKKELKKKAEASE